MDSISEHNESEDDINFWPVYSDLAMVVIIIMLLFLIAQFVINTKLIGASNLEVINNQNMVRNTLLVGNPDDPHPQYRKGIADIQNDGNLQLITFSSDIIFGFNESDWSNLSEIGRSLITDFGKNIARNQKMIKRIQIEGHASWEANHSNFPSDKAYDLYNWDISAKRALTIGQAFISQGVNADKISFAGRAHFVPVDPRKKYTDLSGSNLNRRINVILFYTQHGMDSPILR